MSRTKRTRTKVETAPSKLAQDGTPRKGGSPSPATPAAAGARDKTLTEVERRKLDKLETEIEAGLASFLTVGRALVAIQTDSLFRADHRTFEEYCKARWGMSRQHAYRLLNAAQCYDTLKAKFPGSGVLPTNEAQLRPLVALDDQRKCSVWKSVVAETTGAGITAATVTSVIRKLVPGARKGAVKKKKGIPDLRKQVGGLASKVEAVINDAKKTKAQLVKSLQELLKGLRALAPGF